MLVYTSKAQRTNLNRAGGQAYKVWGLVLQQIQHKNWSCPSSFTQLIHQLFWNMNKYVSGYSALISDIQWI